MQMNKALCYAPAISSTRWQHQWHTRLPIAQLPLVLCLGSAALDGEPRVVPMML